MAIIDYTFNYNIYEAEACFKVDTEIFDKEMALATLNFFSWDWDKEADEIDEVLKKYAIKAIEYATFNNHNVFGVKRDFAEGEGFASVDGTKGIELMNVTGYEFDEDYFDITKVSDGKNKAIS